MKARRNETKLNPVRVKTKHLLLCDPNFVSNSEGPSFERRPLACEASALTAELTAHNHIYFSPNNQPCKHRVLASSESFYIVLKSHKMPRTNEGLSVQLGEVNLNNERLFMLSLS